MTTIMAGDQIIRVADIERVDISRLMDDHIAVIVTPQGEFTAEGFHAIEAVMATKPSALEGKRLRWRKGAWAFHNMVGHPVMQIMAWLGYGAAAVRFHDRTTPKPIGFR